MLIGEVSRHSGVSVRMLRHYDRLGLVRPATRTAGGYRDYSPDDIARLFRVVGLRALGVSLAGIKTLLDTPGTAEPADLVDELIAKTRQRITRETALLTRLTRIADAARDAGREAEPALVVVTKTHPAEDVVRLAALGVTDVGENRDQEARPKAEAVAAALGADAPRWHFVGQLQTNKAKYVVRYASVVESVDRPELAEALSRALLLRREREPEAAIPDLECLVQVDVDDRADEDRPEGIGPRGGARPEDVPALADVIAGLPGLRLGGLMCVAPRGLDPEHAFRRLAALGARLRQTHPEATALSMGMSADLEAAVRAGATQVRIGSDVLGARDAVG